MPRARASMLNPPCSSETARPRTEDQRENDLTLPAEWWVREPDLEHPSSEPAPDPVS